MPNFNAPKGPYKGESPRAPTNNGMHINPSGQSGFSEIKEACPVCGHDGWCAVSDDQTVVMCRRSPAGSFKTKLDASGVAFHLHRVKEGGLAWHKPGAKESIPKPRIPLADIETRDVVYNALLDLLELARTTRMTFAVLACPII